MEAIKKDVASGKVTHLLAFGENLLGTAGFEEKDLKGLTFLGHSHILGNSTASLADVVLPGAGFAEKRATYVNIRGRLQRAYQAVLPPGSAREEWETFAAILGKLDPDFQAPASVDGVLKRLASEVKAFSGVSFGKIGDEGISIVENNITVPLLEKERARKEKGEIVG